MAAGDIWRVAMTVRTTHLGGPPPDPHFEWVVVYHYEDIDGTNTDADVSLELIQEQIERSLGMTSVFAGNTFIVNVDTLNLDSLFSNDQDLSQFIGNAGDRCLPPQVAIAVTGRGIELGRRAMKYWGSISESILGADGLLVPGAATTEIETETYRDVFGFLGSFLLPVIFGAGETPKKVDITRTILSASWRTQRRRVEDFQKTS